MTITRPSSTISFADDYTLSAYGDISYSEINYVPSAPSGIDSPKEERERGYGRNSKRQPPPNRRRQRGDDTIYAFLDKLSAIEAVSDRSATPLPDSEADASDYDDDSYFPLRNDVDDDDNDDKEDSDPDEEEEDEFNGDTDATARPRARAQGRARSGTITRQDIFSPPAPVLASASQADQAPSRIVVGRAEPTGKIDFSTDTDTTCINAEYQKKNQLPSPLKLLDSNFSSSPSHSHGQPHPRPRPRKAQETETKGTDGDNHNALGLGVIEKEKDIGIDIVTENIAIANNKNENRDNKNKAIGKKEKDKRNGNGNVAEKPWRSGPLPKRSPLPQWDWDTTGTGSFDDDMNVSFGPGSSSMSMMYFKSHEHKSQVLPPEPVPKKIIEEIIDAARYAPSGNNMQPWEKVYCLSGDLLKDISAEMIQAYKEHPDAYNAEYHYYPQGPLPEVYAQRRQDFGKRHYTAIHVDRKDLKARAEASTRNYDFYGAPVAFVFTINQALTKGSWLDVGYFLQSITIAARARGLECVSQEAPAKFQLILRKHLHIKDQEVVALGMAMGYPDLEKVAQFSAKQPKREVEDIIEFHGLL
ncbi:hypothetical protein D9758_005957 [Tetrapyrgos nigripes]|uniref:Nitroreductase domain-containing protein n=1 Tax=Tetrapyrgos nigripes TaxID=182062 RepID=A0A8H5G334_9AGAR|nr:hypothetical protein D9758_005957 [Tetrapyrgos nigripes]